MLGLGIRGQRRNDAEAERTEHRQDFAPVPETDDREDLAEAA
jgi:hypothetical protein